MRQRSSQSVLSGSWLQLDLNVLLREALKSEEPIKHFPEGWVSKALPMFHAHDQGWHPG